MEWECFHCQPLACPQRDMNMNMNEHGTFTSGRSIELSTYLPYLLHVSSAQPLF